MITYQDHTRIAATAGGLRVYLWHVGGAADETGGIRRKYGYRISDEHNSAHAPVEAYDLYSGVSAPVDPRHALSTLVSFLAAAGEAYRANVSDPGKVSETADLFPPWVAEVAYINDTELAELALAIDGDETGLGPLSGPASPVKGDVEDTATERRDRTPERPPL